MPLVAAPDTLLLSQVAPELRGTELLGLLAYPEPDKLDARTLAAFRLSYRMHRPEFDWVQSADGAILPVDRRKAEGGAKRLEERLRRRVIAGGVALQAIHALQKGEPLAYLNGRRWTLDEALRQQSETARWQSKTNLHRRVWATSTPVLHIAAAWVEMMRLPPKMGGQALGLLDLIGDVERVDSLLARSQALEAVVIACPELALEESNLIKIR